MNMGIFPREALFPQLADWTKGLVQSVEYFPDQTCFVPYSQVHHTRNSLKTSIPSARLNLTAIMSASFPVYHFFFCCENGSQTGSDNSRIRLLKSCCKSNPSFIYPELDVRVRSMQDSCALLRRNATIYLKWFYSTVKIFSLRFQGSVV